MDRAQVHDLSDPQRPEKHCVMLSNAISVYIELNICKVYLLTCNKQDLIKKVLLIIL